MKQIFGMSQKGDLKEAVKGLSKPQVLFLMSNKNQFEAHVAQLKKLFPNTPSIGCIGMSYDTRIVEEGVGVVAYYGVAAVTNVLEQASLVPVKYIGRLERDMESINADANDTVCIDFCSGNDACVLTTAHSMLKKRGISLVGGTGGEGKIAVNGKIYEDACAYALIKNQTGKVKVYKENIYKPMGQYRLIASETDRSRYLLGMLNGKPAKKVYMEILNVKEEDICTQTFQNPFGKLSGEDICIISIQAVEGNALTCYRQVNDSDVLTMLELVDYKQTVQETIHIIREDFEHISAVFSVNCLFRYKLFSQNNDMGEYLSAMAALGNHVGLIGYGEHYNNQFVNQSMSCVVFE